MILLLQSARADGRRGNGIEASDTSVLAAGCVLPPGHGCSSAVEEINSQLISIVPGRSLKRGPREPETGANVVRRFTIQPDPGR